MKSGSAWWTLTILFMGQEYITSSKTQHVWRTPECCWTVRPYISGDKQQLSSAFFSHVVAMCLSFEGHSFENIPVSYRKCFLPSAVCIWVCWHRFCNVFQPLTTAWVVTSSDILVFHMCSKSYRGREAHIQYQQWFWEDQRNPLESVKHLYFGKRRTATVGLNLVSRIRLHSS